MTDEELFKNCLHFSGCYQHHQLVAELWLNRAKSTLIRMMQIEKISQYSHASEYERQEIEIYLGGVEALIQEQTTSEELKLLLDNWKTSQKQREGALAKA